MGKMTYEFEILYDCGITERIKSNEMTRDELEDVLVTSRRTFETKEKGVIQFSNEDNRIIIIDISKISRIRVIK